ncbi:MULTISPECIES: EboA domain-containing protein [Streptomycetaceae]|uniref:EboA domain-containing protein n=1 Tax=Streptomycetaceae TaxID=2062 RepID=UPI000AA2C327|nr:EboA domain-containing protein [Streptomyces sp. CB02056]
MSFGNAARVTVRDLRAALDRQLTPDAARWLATALTEVAAEPDQALPRRFAEAGRRGGRALLAAAPAPHQDPAPAVPAEALAWTVDDAVRALLLAAAPAPADGPAVRASAVYRHGDAAERRGVLRALGPLDLLAPYGLRDDAVPLVSDALRTNDPRLLAAALGPYGARHLPAPAYREAVLKCLHCSLPLQAVAGLPHRTDAELARMAATHARELTSAGRPVPGDVRALAGPRPAATDPLPPPHPAGT